jgi:hypothetical protein
MFSFWVLKAHVFILPEYKLLNKLCETIMCGFFKNAGGGEVS